jgi:hypothetical protein
VGATAATVVVKAAAAGYVLESASAAVETAPEIAAATIPAATIPAAAAPAALLLLVLRLSGRGRGSRDKGAGDLALQVYTKLLL